MRARVLKLHDIWLLAVLLQGCGGEAQGTAEAQYSASAQHILASKEALSQGFGGLPGWAEEAVLAQQLHQKYSMGTWMSPNLLVGDFDGDGLEDVAFLISHVASAEKGVLILHQDAGNTYNVLRAGTAFEGMQDMDWIEVFEVVEAGQTVAPTLLDEESGDILGEDLQNAVELKSDAIFVHLAEACGGGIIYRKEGAYSWINIE